MFNPSAPEFVPTNSSFHFDAQAPEFVPRAAVAAAAVAGIPAPAPPGQQGGGGGGQPPPGSVTTEQPTDRGVAPGAPFRHPVVSPPQFVSNGGFIPTSIMGLNVGPVVMPTQRPPGPMEPPPRVIPPNPPLPQSIHMQGPIPGIPVAAMPMPQMIPVTMPPPSVQPLIRPQPQPVPAKPPKPSQESEQTAHQPQPPTQSPVQQQPSATPTPVQQQPQPTTAAAAAPPTENPPLPPRQQTSWAAKARMIRDLPVIPDRPATQIKAAPVQAKKAPTPTSPQVPDGGRPGTQPPKKTTGGRRAETSDKHAGRGSRNRRGKAPRSFRDNTPGEVVAEEEQAPPRPVSAAVTRAKPFVDAVKATRANAKAPARRQEVDVAAKQAEEASAAAAAAAAAQKKKAEEDAAKREQEAQAEAQRRAEQVERERVESEARKKAEEEEARRKADEEAARKLAEEEKAKAEAKAEAEAKAKVAEEEEAARVKAERDAAAAAAAAKAKAEAEERAACASAEEARRAETAKKAEEEAKIAEEAKKSEDAAKKKADEAAQEVGDKTTTESSIKADAESKAEGDQSSKPTAGKLPGLSGAWRVGRLIGGTDDRVGGMLDRVKHSTLASLDNIGPSSSSGSLADGVKSGSVADGVKLTFAQAAASPAVVRPATVVAPSHTFDRVPGSKNIRYRLEDMFRLREDPNCQGLPERHNLPSWVLLPSRLQERGLGGGTPSASMQSMIDIGRSAKGDLGKFNRPAGLIMKKGIASSDLAASESSWSTGGARPRNLGQSTASFGRSGTGGVTGSGNSAWPRSKPTSTYGASQSYGASSGIPQFVTGHAIPDIPEGSWQKEQEKIRATAPERGVKVMRRWRAQLNKMTPTTHHAIFEAIMEIGILDVQEAEEFVKLIFDKAITNHGYIDMYADLCFELKTELEKRGIFSSAKTGNTEGDSKDAGAGTDFRRMLLSQCQTAFETHMANDFQAPPDALEEEAFELLLAHKKKMKGNLMFVGCLARSQLVPSRVLITILQQTLEIRRPLQLEALASFLPTCVSGLRDAKWLKSFDQLIERVRDTAHDPNIEQRVRYLLMDALDVIDTMKPPAAQVEQRQQGRPNSNPFEFLKSL